MAAVVAGEVTTTEVAGEVTTTGVAGEVTASVVAGEVTVASPLEITVIDSMSGGDSTGGDEAIEGRWGWGLWFLKRGRRPFNSTTILKHILFILLLSISL
ncbi:hypothetical protein Hanom_Chr00s000003g01604831 [Helianthus anomalus]